MTKTFDYPAIDLFSLPFSVNVDLLHLPAQAQPFHNLIGELAETFSLHPTLVFAIGDLESGWGTKLNPKGPGGTGDKGHGRGLFQIDDRTWLEWLTKNDWRDPKVNGMKGMSILTTYYAQCLRANIDREMAQWTAIAAYNAGPGPAISRFKLDGDPNAVTWHDATNPPKYCNEIWKRLQSLPKI